MRISLSAPFTERLDPHTQLIQPMYRNWLARLISFLEGKGHQVINSHVREDWGGKLEPPEIAIVNDFTSIKDSHLIIAYIGNPPSPGVQMELGFASSFGKRIIILTETDSEMPYLARGLHRLTDAVLIRFDSQEDLIAELDKLV
jgi:hypothetical protein